MKDMKFKINKSGLLLIFLLNLVATYLQDCYMNTVTASICVYNMVYCVLD